MFVLVGVVVPRHGVRVLAVDVITGLWVLEGRGEKGVCASSIEALLKITHIVFHEVRVGPLNA